MGLFDWFKKEKPENLPEEVFNPEDKEDIDFYIESHVSAINMGLRGMTDKRGKELNTELIKSHLIDVLKDGHTLGFQQGKNASLTEKLKNELNDN